MKRTVENQRIFDEADKIISQRRKSKSLKTLVNGDIYFELPVKVALSKSKIASVLTAWLSSKTDNCFEFNPEISLTYTNIALLFK